MGAGGQNAFRLQQEDRDVNREQLRRQQLQESLLADNVQNASLSHKLEEQRHKRMMQSLLQHEEEGQRDWHIEKLQLGQRQAQKQQLQHDQMVANSQYAFVLHQQQKQQDWQGKQKRFLQEQEQEQALQLEQRQMQQQQTQQQLLQESLLSTSVQDASIIHRQDFKQTQD